MKQDFSKWRPKIGKTKVSNLEDKKKGAKLEEFNVMHNIKEVSDDEKTHGYIFCTSFDSMFLKAKDIYAMSDWILDPGVSLHVSLNMKWFTTYIDEKYFVKLGNNQQPCGILGIRDI